MDEDNILSEEVISFLLDKHSYFSSHDYREVKASLVSVKRHLYITQKDPYPRTLEIDAVIYYKLKRQVLSIGLELKYLTDMYKLVEVIGQAKVRRNLFNYFYIITKGSPEYLGYKIREAIRTNAFQALEREKIGWIFVCDERIFFLYPSRKISIPSIPSLDNFMDREDKKV